MLLLAHRGASADAPENTLAAFREAVRQRADGVELDAMCCGSGEVVVCHDERLDRLAGLPWEVARTPLWKLRRAEVGAPLGFAPGRVPLLEEVLAELPAPMLINIELKCEALDDRGLSEKVGALVTAANLVERVVVSSFNALCLARLARAFPQIRRGYLIDPDKPFWLHGGLIAPVVSTWSIHPPAASCSPRRIAAWHRGGYKVAAWTVDDPGEARRLREWGVDYLITNRPAAVRAALGG